MKTIIRSFVAAAAIATVAGCGPLAGVLANPPVVPGMAGASAAPGAVASTAPGATTPAATTPAATTPAATTAPKPDGDISDTSSDCKVAAPAATPEKGSAELGEFAGQNLPAGYNKAYSTAAQVYEAIGKLDIDNWACFQKFYPGAAGLYKKKMGL